MISIDEKFFYSPTKIDVWLQRDNSESMCIPAGRKMNLNFQGKHPFKTMVTEEKKLDVLPLFRIRWQYRGNFIHPLALQMKKSIYSKLFVAQKENPIKRYQR